MAWSGGTFSRVHDWTTDAADVPPKNIEASRMDAEDDNFATGINSCLHKGGQNTPTADLPMGGYNHTGVANGSARDEYSSVADVQDQDLIFAVDTGAADAYTITVAPAITAYEEGQRFVFRAINANTGASTLAVNGLAATDIETNDGSALSAGMIASGGYYEVTYDANGSRFVMTSPHSKGVIGTDVQAWAETLDDLAAVPEVEAANAFLVSTGLGAWQAQAAATARASMGVTRANLSLDTSDSPQFAAVNLSSAADTTVSGSSGQVLVEGKGVMQHNGAFTSGEVFFSTSAPVAEGDNGDIWFEYTA